MESQKFSEILKENYLLAKQIEGITPYRIRILSNVTCNQLKPLLEYNLRKSKLNPLINIGNYDNIIQDSYNCGNSQLVVIHYELINILDKFNEFIEDFNEEQITSLFQTIKSEIDLILGNL